MKTRSRFYRLHVQRHILLTIQRFPKHLFQPRRYPNQSTRRRTGLRYRHAPDLYLLRILCFKSLADYFPYSWKRLLSYTTVDHDLISVNTSIDVFEYLVTQRLYHVIVYLLTNRVHREGHATIPQAVRLEVRCAMMLQGIRIS